MATATTPRIELNNGVELPTVGLGVFQSPPAETVGAVETAIANGYRLIDTAAAYGNEREVGEGIRRSGVDRDEMFVSTKLWISDYGYDAAQVGFDASLRRLGVDYVDLYLLHRDDPSVPVGPIVEALDGSLAPTTPRGAAGHRHRDHKPQALLAGVWERVRQAELSVLGSVTLKELVERQQQLEQQRALMYHI